MAVILYNPHVDDFLAEPIHFRILKRRALKKYGFLIEQSRLAGRKVLVLVDATVSGLIPDSIFQRLPAPLRRLLSAIEFNIWKKINGFGEDVRLVVPTKAPSPDLLLVFSYKAATGSFALRQPVLSRYRAVIFHLSHYFVSTREKAANIRALDNAFLAGDSDISGAPYFKEYFGWYQRQFLILPFAIADRFMVKQPWNHRDQRVVATGSFHDLRLERPARKYRDFMDATGATTYHPIRKAIHDASNSLEGLINCKTSPYRQYGSSRLMNFLSHFRVSQKKYFSINIVDLYNAHRFALVGEELSGFPALGAFEAMACGCVLLAQPQYYEGLGLEPGRHYLAYRGSVDDLVAKIGEAQKLPLERISYAASEIVRAEFNSRAVFNKWHAVCDRLSDLGTKED